MSDNRRLGYVFGSDLYGTFKLGNGAADSEYGHTRGLTSQSGTEGFREYPSIFSLAN